MCEYQVLNEILHTCNSGFKMAVLIQYFVHCKSANKCLINWKICAITYPQCKNCSYQAAYQEKKIINYKTGICSELCTAVQVIQSINPSKHLFNQFLNMPVRFGTLILKNVLESIQCCGTKWVCGAQYNPLNFTWTPPSSMLC